jgi:hypothetical protein
MEVPYTADATVIATTDIIGQYSGSYYDGINASATNNVLKSELQALISQKTTVSYDGVWYAFEEVDKFLEGYPCSSDLTMIPDIYSDYCWHPEKNVEFGECGNY